MRSLTLLLLIFGSLIVPLLGVSLRAQDLTIDHKVDERRIMGLGLSVFAGSGTGSGTGGGYGFILVDLQNEDSAAHAVRVEISTRTHTQSSVELRRTVGLGPYERARLHLPMPVLSRYAFDVIVTVDNTIYEEYMTAGRTGGPAALVVSDNEDFEPATLGLVQQLWPSKRRSKPRVVTCPTVDAPRDWRLYTAFPLVVVDGMSRIDEERQAALRRFAHAGGSLLLVGADRLDPGELRENFEAFDDGQRARTGFGFVTVAGPRLDFDHLVPGLLGSGKSIGVWPLEHGLQVRQEIPGLAQAPVLVFLFVILMFAIVVGPINLFMLRRAKRPMLALVTVPAIGLGTTLLMFGYAILHDGFGVRGVERSWTVLDQQNHEVATIASRTLFAGLSPADLTLGADSILLSPAAYRRPDQRSRHRWSFDGDRGTILGNVVPARTETALVSARQGISRARLRARRLPDGDLELLSDGGVQPTGGLLLRDDDGAYWFGDGGRLTRISTSDAEDWLGELEEHVSGHLANEVSPTLHVLGSFESLFAGRELPRGTYMTHVAEAPWVPDHGLAPDYERQRHFVYGRLGPEDIVR